MTLWHINDFEKVAEDVPQPWPWTIIGVMPTQNEYERLGDAAFHPDRCFCYTVSDGPTELWCPMQSIEGRLCSPEVVSGVLNVLFAAIGANQLAADDNVIVPFEYYSDDDTDTPVVQDAVFWIGTPTEDPDNHRFHCYQSRHRWVLPIRWSSPEGFPDE